MIKFFGSLLRKLQVKYLLQNIEIGENLIIDYQSKIINNNNSVKIGKNVTLRSNKRGYHAGMPFEFTLLCDFEGAKVEIGDYCRINGAYIHAKKYIKIGQKCVIASGVNILDSNGHRTDSIDRTKDRDNPESIIIGNNVWIGLNAVILKNTRIGDNSIISANSVVKGFFPSNSLIMGNPAKLIKSLEINENSNSQK